MDNRNTEKEIAKIDEQMAKLFEQRLLLCQDEAAAAECGLSSRNEAQEKEAENRLCENIADNDIRSYYARFLKSIFEISADYRAMCRNGMNVAYGGVEGAYAYIASKRMFPEAKLNSKADFLAAYSSVESGECDIAVLPIENSLAGEVGEVMDLIYRGPLHINRVFDLPIKHHLLGIKGSTREGIKTVISHPQALAQCNSYVHKNGLETQTAANTSAAAAKAVELNDVTVGVIASEETAQMFGLEILDSDIQNALVNTTRFAAFSRTLYKPRAGVKGENDKFILVYTVKNEAGALAATLNIIGAHGFNMRCLRSRPLKSLPWNYYFYIELEGNINTPNGSDMMRELAVICADLKLVGTWR
ncbi:MAG: chorismate mutase [Lachnospiraceae bacterium]|nr:chorismate mutase [Lachnospiraceae bacterium]